MPNLVSIAGIVAEISAFIQTEMSKLTRSLMWSKRFHLVGSLTPSAAY